MISGTYSSKRCNYLISLDFLFLKGCWQKARKLRLWTCQEEHRHKRKNLLKRSKFLLTRLHLFEKVKLSGKGKPESGWQSNRGLTNQALPWLSITATGYRYRWRCHSPTREVRGRTTAAGAGGKWKITGRGKFPLDKVKTLWAYFLNEKENS